MIVDKMREKTLRLCSGVIRREETETARAVMKIIVKDNCREMKTENEYDRRAVGGECRGCGRSKQVEV